MTIININYLQILQIHEINSHITRSRKNQLTFNELID